MLCVVIETEMCFCSERNIEVNQDKTEVVVFNNGWKLLIYSYQYDQLELKVGKSYIQLITMFHCKG